MLVLRFKNATCDYLEATSHHLRTGCGYVYILMRFLSSNLLNSENTRIERCGFPSFSLAHYRLFLVERETYPQIPEAIQRLTFAGTLSCLLSGALPPPLEPPTPPSAKRAKVGGRAMDFGDVSLRSRMVRLCISLGGVTVCSICR